MAICILHEEMDSECPCSDAYKAGLTLQAKLAAKNLSILDLYKRMIKENYCIESEDMINLFTKNEHNLTFNKAHIKLSRVIISNKVPTLKLIDDMENEKIEKLNKGLSFPEIKSKEEFEENQEYIAYGISHGDFHLSDVEIETWRRVKFQNGRITVIEKEDSSRGHFVVKKIFKLPSIK